jgi:hypothetical protein
MSICTHCCNFYTQFCVIFVTFLLSHEKGRADILKKYQTALQSPNVDLWLYGLAVVLNNLIFHVHVFNDFFE